jgi:hypothetical protein
VQSLSATSSAQRCQSVRLGVVWWLEKPAARCLMPIELGIVFAVLGGFVAMITGCAIWGRRRGKRRANDIRAVGSELGLTYFPKADPEWLSALSWRQKLSFSYCNLLFGQTDDLTIRLFEHFYTIGVGSFQFPRWQTMVIFQSWALNDLPDFSLWPDMPLYRIASLFGYKRIEFESHPSHPSFSESFLLRASDEVGIRQVFDDETLAFFEQASNVCVEFHDTCLLFYRKGVRIKPAEIRSFLDEGFAVYRLLRSRTSVVANDDSRPSVGQPVIVADQQRDPVSEVNG